MWKWDHYHFVSDKNVHLATDKYFFVGINTEFIYQYKKAQKGGIPQIHPLYVYMLFMFVSKNIRTCVKYECKSDDFLSVCDLIMWTGAKLTSVRLCMVEPFWFYYCFMTRFNFCFYKILLLCECCVIWYLSAGVCLVFNMPRFHHASFSLMSCLDVSIESHSYLTRVPKATPSIMIKSIYSFTSLVHVSLS